MGGGGKGEAPCGVSSSFPSFAQPGPPPRRVGDGATGIVNVSFTGGEGSGCELGGPCGLAQVPLPLPCTLTAWRGFSFASPVFLTHHHPARPSNSDRHKVGHGMGSRQGRRGSGRGRGRGRLRPNAWTCGIQS